MDKEKETISEVVFPIIKNQFITCCESKCARCYENSKGACSSAATANEIEVALVNAGYGNVEQAIKEFAEKFGDVLWIKCGIYKQHSTRLAGEVMTVLHGRGER